MHDTKEHGSLSAGKNPVLVAIMLPVGQPGTGTVVAGFFVVVPVDTVAFMFDLVVVAMGLAVVAMGRAVVASCAGFAFKAEITFDGVVAGVEIITNRLLFMLLDAPDKLVFKLADGLAVVVFVAIGF